MGTCTLLLNSSESDAMAMAICKQHVDNLGMLSVVQLDKADILFLKEAS